MYRDDCQLSKDRIAELEAENQALRTDANRWRDADLGRPKLKQRPRLNPAMQYQTTILVFQPRQVSCQNIDNQQRLILKLACLL